jgi:ectoine hydroxylase-related dioxygenase (phytanoyl-CoA dioxygenase family)
MAFTFLGRTRPVGPTPQAPLPLDDLPSRFGGFWTDTASRDMRCQQLVDAGEVTTDEAERLRFWIANGYVVIPAALDDAAVARVQRAIDDAIDRGTRQMTWWDADGKHQEPARRDRLAAAEAKVIDVHAHVQEVQQAIFAPAIARFLELVMRSRAVAFQTLYFEHGSEQGVHQDTAFVYVDPPLEFMASWIALEDIQAGSGELVYFPGSHRLPDMLFGQPPGKALLPGDPAGADYSARLAERCEAAGLRLEPFRPRRGDTLIWAADLVHGGSPRLQPLTRRSLVTHYCPAHRRPPYAGPSSRPAELSNGHFVLSQT